MTPVELLQELKGFTEAQVKNMVYETQTTPGEAQVRRAPEVWLMRLPDTKSKTKKAPYVLLQLVSGADEQNAGELQDSTCSIRIVVCLYANDASEGALNVADVLMCLRTALLRQQGNDDHVGASHKGSNAEKQGGSRDVHLCRSHAAGWISAQEPDAARHPRCGAGVSGAANCNIPTGSAAHCTRERTCEGKAQD